MWKEGAILIHGKVYHYEVKVYGKDSEYGLNGSNLSKIYITQGGNTVAHYERGWNVEPKDEDTFLAIAILIKQYKE